MNNKSIILFGYKSVGKSYFGQLLSKKLQIAFIDTDQLIESLYEKERHEKMNCRQIVHNNGEEYFRLLESKVITQLDKKTSAVIAVGGGAVLAPENSLKLAKLGKLVYLEADKAMIKQRMFQNGIPLFLDSADPDNSFDKMYETRKTIYENVSQFIVSLQGKTDRQVLDELVDIHLMLSSEGKFRR